MAFPLLSDEWHGINEIPFLHLQKDVVSGKIHEARRPKTKLNTRKTSHKKIRGRKKKTIRKRK
jgi:hypothetical protein